MNIGMLWFDNDPKVNLDTKIERAAYYYARKYGRNPTLCFVHPSMLANTPTKAVSFTAETAPKQQERSSPPATSGGIEVRSSRSVLPNHFWIGISGAAEAGGA